MVFMILHCAAVAALVAIGVISASFGMMPGVLGILCAVTLAMVYGTYGGERLAHFVRSMVRE